MKLPPLAMLVASLSAAGCASSPPPEVLPAFNPADPVMGLRDTHYRPVIIDYHHRDPVDPQNWRRQNEQLSPAQPGGDS
jgi:hypothetical protein